MINICADPVDQLQMLIGTSGSDNFHYFSLLKWQPFIGFHVNQLSTYSS